MSLRCIYCGLPEEDHHAFVAPEQPAGCVCDPHEWGNPLNIPPPCKKFVGKAGQYCRVCEHDEACHAADRREG